MATKNQREHKQRRRLHHNKVNRTSVPNESIARSKRATFDDLVAMNVTPLRKLAKNLGIVGVSKSDKETVLDSLKDCLIRKDML